MSWAVLVVLGAVALLLLATGAVGPPGTKWLSRHLGRISEVE